ncbi:MAG: prolyl oligopeptidase family serine peptidase [Oscillibacter sp.]|nr:prolyl oligopeptidase family serine peptidase [Oscillibacter sp.]
MKQRILLLMLVCVSAMALLTACGGGPAPEDQTAPPEGEQAEPEPEGGMSAVAGEETDSYACQLHGTVTDAGQVVSSLTIDFGEAYKVSGVDAETFTVHAAASTEAIREGTDLESYGDYDIDRAIVKTETDGQTVTLYFDESEGATLAYTSGARNYPAELTYTITQNKPLTLTAADGTVLNESYTAAYTCDNTVLDPETAKFTSVLVEDGINYQFYNGETDKLVVWFHGNGEGDLLSSGNNVAQMLANRGTVAWASDEFQEILGGASVMAFQAPDTWYYAQRDGLLDKAAEEIHAVVEQYGIDPAKVVVSGCSAGGYMTTRMIIAHPDLFRAAIINCPAYDVADDRGGETPTDEELNAVKDSGVPIWLVQGRTDSVVASEACSQRLFAILTDGAEVTETVIQQEQPENSDFTTYETADGQYKLSLYDTTEEDMLRFAEDYNQDGVLEEVQYSSHWSWIYSLKNNPQAADGTHIVNWAAGFVNG